MLGVLLILLFLGVPLYLLGFAKLAVVHFGTLYLIDLFFPVGCQSFRAGSLVRFIGRSLERVNFDERSRAILAALDPTQQYMFCYEPHGSQALALCFTAAAHGGNSMPLALAQNCVVVGHWILALIPIVAQLFALYGVVFSLPKWQIYRALEDGRNVALCPSGLQGKYASLVRPRDENHAKLGNKDVVHVVRRQSTAGANSSRSGMNEGGLGFIALAIRHHMLLVPILSTEEDVAFDCVMQHSYLPQLAWPVGRSLLFPVVESMNVRVGTPISTDNLDSANPHHITQLSDVFYKAVKELGQPDTAVMLQ